jgi:KUP system potassium uptake protein
MHSKGHTAGQTAKAGLALGALGVVFGDIGTSPLYALRESIAYLPVADRTTGVLGILSLIFWSLLLVVSWKYLTFVTRADNRGEGGIFALFAKAKIDPRRNKGGVGSHPNSTSRRTLGHPLRLYRARRYLLVSE